MADKYDLIVLGSGPGGYVAAIRGAQLGLKVAIVERELLGGICLNWGCIPTKALLRSAEILHYAQNAKDYGLKIAGEIEADLDAVVKRSRGVAKQLNQGVTHLMKKNKIAVHMGEGKLTGPTTLTVKGEKGEEKLEAKHIIVATGARARAGGDDDVLGFELFLALLALHGQRGGAGQLALAHMHRDLVLLHQVRDALVELLGNAAAAFDHRIQIGLDLARDLQAVILGVLRIMEDFRRAQQRLGRDAAPVEADAAEQFALHDGDLESQLRPANRGDVATRPAAQNDEIILVGHGNSLFNPTDVDRVDRSPGVKNMLRRTARATGSAGRRSEYASRALVASRREVGQRFSHHCPTGVPAPGLPPRPACARGAACHRRRRARR